MKKVGKKPLISVIVPVYNVEKYLNKCIDSIISQTYENLEILIVNDGSTDNSGKICEEYAKNDKRIKIIHQKNGGLSAARNTGIKNSTGEYIGFVDSDDWIDQEMYQTLYEILTAYDGDISACGITKVDNESEKIKLRKPKVSQYTQSEYLKKYFKINSQSCEYYACNKLYKRTLLTNTQYPIGLTSEDVLGTYKAILHAGKVVATTQNYYHYRQNSQSITGSFSKKDFDLLTIWDKVIEYTKENAPQYLDYAILNRKRINLTLLYRIATSGATKQSSHNATINDLLKSLRQDKNALISSPIPFTRKILIVMFCTNYKISAKLLYAIKRIASFLRDVIKSPYFLFPKNQQKTKVAQGVTQINLLLILFSLIIFFEPQAFKETYYPFLIQVDNIYKILKLICSGYIIFLYLKNCQLSKFIGLVCVFQAICLLSTIINHGSITRFTGPALTTIVMAMSAEILIHTKNLFIIIKQLLIYFRVIFILNLFTIFIIDFTPLESNVYLLGIDNRWIFTYMPWICLEFLYSVYANGKLSKTSILLFLLSESTLIWRKSYAAMILFALWIFFVIKPKLPVAKHAVTIFGGTIIANLSIVVFRVQNLFKFALDKIGKGTTLSGRTYLWNSVFEVVKSKPWLGNGMQSVAYDKNFFFTTSKTNLPFLHVVHAHNTYMTTLYRYGLVGLSLFTAILYMPIQKLKANYTNRYANVLFTCIVITLLLGIFDTLDYSGFYFILSCAYAIEVIGPLQKPQIHATNLPSKAAKK